MTLDQASVYLSIPARTLRLRIGEKVLKGTKSGKRLLFSKEQLDTFMKRFTL